MVGGEDECLSKALSFLSSRPRTASETRSRMLKWGYPPQTADSVLSRLERSGLIDDEGFALVYMEEMLRKGLGARSIQGKLIQKGLDRELVGEVMDGYPAEMDGERALQAARERFRVAQSLQTGDARRISDFLLRRGFPGSTAREVAKVMVHVDSDFGPE